MPEPRKKGPSADEVFGQITKKIASIDGIATADAVELGSLIRQYGQTVAGEATSGIMSTMIDAMLKEQKEPRKPWEGPG